MLFLRALHTCCADLLIQFASKQKDLSLASIDSVVSDAKFMDEFTVVGASGKPKPGHPSPPPRSPTGRVRVSVTAPYLSGWCRMIRALWLRAGVNLSVEIFIVILQWEVETSSHQMPAPW